MQALEHWIHCANINTLNFEQDWSNDAERFVHRLCSAGADSRFTAFEPARRHVRMSCTESELPFQHLLMSEQRLMRSRISSSGHIVSPSTHWLSIQDHGWRKSQTCMAPGTTGWEGSTPRLKSLIANMVCTSPPRIQPEWFR